MNCYGERYQSLHLPAAGSVVETLRACVSQPQAAASGTCLPLSITKSPVAAWPGYLQPLRLLCAPPRAAALPLLRCQPCVPRAVLLGREACEATGLVARAAAAATCSPQPCAAGRPGRVAKSLPPCAPKCPEPGKLRFPPCGIRYSASCRGERAAAAARGSKRAATRAGPGGYSRPLQGGTECPQERAPPERVLRERMLQECGVPLQRCTKGYPMQHCVSPCLLQPLDTKPTPAPKGDPCVTRGSLPHGTKMQRPGTPHIAKSRGARPCVPPHAARPHAGAGKGSGHGKKSRCAAKWFW